MFWFIASAVAILSALMISVPLFKAGRAGEQTAPNDAEVYRDQLSEIDRDEQAGLIDGGGAAQARTEIARRLIAATERGEKDGSNSLARPTALAVVFCLCLLAPSGATLIYNRMGDPAEADQPLAARMASPEPDINILIAKTEAHLAANPNDGKGWELLAPIYMRRMRAEEAAQAYRKAISLLGENADRYGSLGEALAAASEGTVTKESATAFRRALELDPSDPRARFYVALATAQAGDLDKALADFTALAKDSPADAPWQGVLQAQIDRINADKNNVSAPGNPNAADIEAASGLNDEDRMQMIRTMVETLDERLKTEPQNFEGWMRLVRSYTVLQQPDKASDALKRALTTFSPETANGKALISLARDLGLPVEGVSQ